MRTAEQVSNDVSKASKRQPDIAAEMFEAEEKAWQSLAKYKFMMFGYWAAIWVHLNRIGGFKRPNPFKALIQSARKRCDGGTP